MIRTYTLLKVLYNIFGKYLYSCVFKTRKKYTEKTMFFSGKRGEGSFLSTQGCFSDVSAPWNEKKKKILRLHCKECHCTIHFIVVTFITIFNVNKFHLDTFTTFNISSYLILKRKILRFTYHVTF